MKKTSKIVASSGSTRDNDLGEVRFDLITPYGYERVAVIYGKGAKRHGDRNWEKGMSTSDLINRAIRHLNDYMKGCRKEDYPAKVAWAMFAVMHMEDTKPQFADVRTKVAKCARQSQ